MTANLKTIGTFFLSLASVIHPNLLCAQEGTPRDPTFVILNASSMNSAAQNVPVSTLKEPLNITPAPSPAATGTGISFEQARQSLYARSDRLKASQMSVQSAELRREGVARLGGPSVAVTGMGYAYSMNVDVNLDPARNSLNDVTSQLPPQIGGAVSQLPSIPNNYLYKTNGQSANLNLSAVWPLYVGGFSDAVRGELSAMTDETQAVATSDSNQLNTLLVDRYFNAQLATRAAQLYAQALDTIKKHDEAAQKMLENGVISNVERLEAKAALAHAQDLAKQTSDTAKLANTALMRTIQAEHHITPSTPLFLDTSALPELEHFLNMAEHNHPALKQIEAKIKQAGHLYDMSDALRKPQVLAFANHNLSTISDGASNWIAGMAVRWSLWSDIDRQAMMNSSLRQADQAKYTYAQALTDIALLVEQNWMNVTHARERYEAQAADETLANEMLKLRQAGLREGTSTPLELIDAELNLARVKTERAVSANQYVQSLAALMESTGNPQEFTTYMQRANIHIKQDSL